jgi:hypothetical protein
MTKTFASFVLLAPRSYRPTSPSKGGKGVEAGHSNPRYGSRWLTRLTCLSRISVIFIVTIKGFE